MKNSASTSKYFVTESLKSIKRNKTLSLASIATVMATLFIFGVFLVAVLSIDNIVEQMGSNLQASIYLNDDIQANQITDIQNALQSIDGVKNIEFQDKAKALQNAKDSFGEEGEELVKGLEESNPFSMAFVVTVNNPEHLSKVVNKVNSMPGIKKIKDVREIADKIERWTQAIKVVGISMFIVLMIVSIFLIGNTIKIAVFSRRREIGIMKYVGATDWFIRWPFILEGMFIGFIGSIMSIIILYYGYRYLVFNRFVGNLFIQLISPTYILVSLAWKFILAGAAIGAAGSILSIRKHLKV